MNYQDFDKLTKLMQLAQSSNDHEALAALRRANAILVKNKLNWQDFLTALLRAGRRRTAHQTASFGGFTVSFYQ